LSSGRDLVRLQDKLEPGHGLFALGDPDFNASASTRLAESPASEDTTAESAYYATRNIRSGCGSLKDIVVKPLPGTRKEVQKITSQWKAFSNEPSLVYLGTDASEENFKAEAPGSRIIHLATHGYFIEGACQPNLPQRGFDAEHGFVGENPLLLSGLLFAGANLHGQDADSALAEDGILTAYEVSAMELEGTEMVVLSACETGLGEVKEGEGVYGLRRAFQMAGARTVVSALWPVSDEVTADMMGQLYDNGDGSLPRTIRTIQLKQIAELRANSKVDHPFTWGAFIALGDWR
jgi:CHAT domain-containing protein